MSPGAGRSGGGRGLALVVVALVAAVGVGLLLTSRVEPVPPFDIDSSQADGFKAVRLLLEQHDAEVDSAPASALTDGGLAPGRGDALVVPVPSAASEDELAAALEAARRGAVVVFGEPRLAPDGEYAWSALDDASTLDTRTLADEPAFEVAPGRCDIDVLTDLGDIDTAFATPISPVPAGEQRCYDENDGVHFLRRAEGEGTVVTMSSPFLWVNARLQPRKESGGPPLDNGATAVRLLGDADRVTFIDAVPSADAVISGSQSPIELLPLPVKLALAQLAGAFAIYLWWRSRRLGPPIAERLPVDVAGSELVVAVGDLLRRRGNAARAAETMRADTRAVLGQRLGMGQDPAPAGLVEVVAAHTGRPPAEVGAALYGDPATPVRDADSLVRLVRTLDAIRQEVLHVAVR